MEYIKKQRKKYAEYELEDKRRFHAAFQSLRAEFRAEYLTFDCPGYPLVQCTWQLGTSKVQTIPVKTSVMLPGQLFKDEKGEPTALIDGVIASLFYAFD